MELALISVKRYVSGQINSKKIRPLKIKGNRKQLKSGRHNNR